MAGQNMRICIQDSILRNWNENDIPALVKNANNPRIAAMMRDGFPSPYTQEDGHRFLAMATGYSKNLMLAIVVDGEAAGGIGIHPLEDVYCRTAEIGYWLAEPHWGKGIITHAVRALVPVAFGQFDIIRIEAGIFSNNPASMRVLEKCGFVREAVHRNAITKHGEILDEMLYVRFREK
jgi:[ribosomal protein S5]-alanine N-acetyltransferase